MPSQEFLDGLEVLNLAGKCTRTEYLNAFWIMENKYPGRGWSQGAKHLERFYERMDKLRTDGPVQVSLFEPIPLPPDSNAKKEEEPIPWQSLALDILG
jgi:hypothetical protein